MVEVALDSLSLGTLPPAMIALIAAMVSTLVVLIAITFTWKISVHAAVSSGSITILALDHSPWLMAAYPLVAWSRVALRGHTPAQVMAGAVLGAVVAGVTFELLQ